MASSALRRSLPRRTSLSRSIPPHLPPAAAGAFRRSLQSGDGESVEEFDERLFGSKGAEKGSIYEKLDRAENGSRRYGMGSGMGGFAGFGDRSGSGSSSMGGFPGFSGRSSSGSSAMGGFPGFSDRSGSGSAMGGFPGFSDRSSSGSSSMGGFPGFSDRSSSGPSSMGGFAGFGDRGSSGSAMGGFPGFSDRGSSGSTGFFDTSNDSISAMLGDAARNSQMDDDDDEYDEWEEDDFDFRPDVEHRRGGTYSVRDLDLTRPAAAKNPPRPQFETTTAEVLRKADFRNVRFLSHFLTEAGIIIKRSQTRISAKAQRKIAREIKTARAFGLMPFTTMGRRPFIFGRSAEEHYSEEEYFGWQQRDGEPVEDNGNEEPDVEAA